VDPGIIDRARHGDEDAYTSIVLHFGDRLFSVAYRILRDVGRAEDAVQQAFLVGWQELPRLRDDSRLEAWLYRLLVNACYAEVRQTRRWQPGLRLVADLDSDHLANDEHLQVERRDQLERAFRRLPTDLRCVLVMHHYLGLSGAEISDTLGLSPGTVRSRLHYARQQMRAALDADSRSVATGGMA